MKNLIRKILRQNDVTRLIDFGAGTLFWSKWFADELGVNVIAVDTSYADNPPIIANPKISIRMNIIDVLEEKKRKEKNAIFICDVIHHLPSDFWDSILPQIVELFDVVIIKDIDANCKFGNFCNRMHDRFINGEIICNVNPDEINNYLKSSGYSTQLRAMHKLWYPHFIITGVKANDQ